MRAFASLLSIDISFLQKMPEVLQHRLSMRGEKEHLWACHVI